MTFGETVGVLVWEGVNVTVGVKVEVNEGIGVIVETATTLFPILQLTRTKTDQDRSKKHFATMITSVTIFLLCGYLNSHLPNSFLGVAPSA